MADRFEEFMDFMLSQMKPESENPKDYPRSVLIEDADALGFIAEIRAKRTLAERLGTQMRLLRSEADVLRARLFMRLDEAYPDIKDVVHRSVRWCDWRGKTYYAAIPTQEDREGDSTLR